MSTVRKPAVQIDDWSQFLTGEDQARFVKLNHDIGLLEKHTKEKMLERRKLRTKAQHAARSQALHKLAGELNAAKTPAPTQPDLFPTDGPDVADDDTAGAEPEMEAAE